MAGYCAFICEFYSGEREHDEPQKDYRRCSFVGGVQRGVRFAGVGAMAWGWSRYWTGNRCRRPRGRRHSEPAVLLRSRLLSAAWLLSAAPAARRSGRLLHEPIQIVRSGQRHVSGIRRAASSLPVSDFLLKNREGLPSHHRRETPLACWRRALNVIRKIIKRAAARIGPTLRLGPTCAWRAGLRYAPLAKNEAGLPSRSLRSR